MALETFHIGMIIFNVIIIIATTYILNTYEHTKSEKYMIIAATVVTTAAVAASINFDLSFK